MKQFVKAMIILVFAAAPASAASLTIETTVEETKAAVWLCANSTASNPCTTAEAKAFVMAKIHAMLGNWVFLMENSALQEGGIDLNYLRSVARDETLTLATKCAVMAEHGVQAVFEDKMEVTCP